MKNEVAQPHGPVCDRQEDPGDGTLPSLDLEGLVSLLLSVFVEIRINVAPHVREAEVPREESGQDCYGSNNDNHRPYGQIVETQPR